MMVSLYNETLHGPLYEASLQYWRNEFWPKITAMCKHGTQSAQLASNSRLSCGLETSHYLPCYLLAATVVAV